MITNWFTLVILAGLAAVIVAALIGLAYWIWQQLREAGPTTEETPRTPPRPNTETPHTPRDQNTLSAPLLQAVLDALPEAVLLLDAEQRLMTVNTAARTMLGVTGPTTGRKLIEVLRWQELLDVIQQLRQDQSDISVEMRAPTLTDRLFKVLVKQVNPATETASTPMTLVLVYDITHARELDRLRHEFVAGVSHELRTPLSHIKGYIETLRSTDGVQPENMAKFLEGMARNADRLEKLINDLLDLAALESGQITLRIGPVKLHETLEKVVAEFRPHAAKRRISISTDIPPVTIQADEFRLEQVLANLLDNAIRYGREGGQVNIRAEIMNNQVRVCVRDDGPGIPPEALNRVFERFYRVDPSRRRDTGGAGLGLAIVKHIVQNHGGRVWAESELGHGAAFYFTLPLR